MDLLGQAEVGDLRVAVPVEQDVRWFQVTVDHSVPVGVLDGLGDAANQFGRLWGTQRSFGQALGEALSFDETHRKVVLALVLSDLDDRHDSGMVKVGGGLGLSVETYDVGLVGKLSGEDHLERNGAVEPHLPGLEHDAHAAASDLADDLVIAEVANAGGFGCFGIDRTGLVEPGDGG